MTSSGLVRKALALFVLIACLAPPVSAQINDQLSAYTGANATGYLQPLANAFGADLNTGIFRSASIPNMRPTVRLEIEVMSVLFGDADRTFRAVTEQGFSPMQHVDAPTIVGSEKAVLVEGQGGTEYAFPGGFNLHSFALAAPQLRIGGIFSTEAIIRYFSLKVSGEGKDSKDLGDIGLFGLGLKHSISQHLPGMLPVDLSAGFFWQRFNLGKNKEGGHLMTSDAFSIGVQASKKLPMFFTPYVGLSYDTHKMDLSYDSQTGDTTKTVDVSFEGTSTMHLTLGLIFNAPVVNLFAEYDIASQKSFSFGLGLGF
ncbi:MAG: DUF6588 family protein [Candidatus Krumholzibacteriaceae bacterium]